MKYVVSYDTLHLLVKLPFNTLWDLWAGQVLGLDPKALKIGCPVDLPGMGDLGRTDIIARSGSNGYQFSLWQGDARVYVAKREEMGVWLQLGPKFLRANNHRLRVAVIGLLALLGVPEDWHRADCQYRVHIRVNRFDLAVDVLGHDLGEMPADEWSSGWVGYSRGFDMFRSIGKLKGGAETVAIGSRQSAVYLRVYNKVLEATKTGDIEHWRDVWGGFDGPVTRVEWEVKIHAGGFEDMSDFAAWSDHQVVKLLNYLMTWGRLAVPDPNDGTVTRWASHPFWAELVEGLQGFMSQVFDTARRVNKKINAVSEQYWKFVAGTFAGAMARFGKDRASVYAVFDFLENKGFTQAVLQSKADGRFEVLRGLGLVPG